MNTFDEAASLAAQLLARRWLPRTHPLVKRALIDADLWAAVTARLAGVGLKLVDKLSRSIESHYAWMEKTLGKQKLAQLYLLLDQVIELEQP